MNPAFRAVLMGPVRSWLVSQLHAVWAIVVFATGLEVARGNVSDFRTWFLFISSPSFEFGLFLAIVFGIGPFSRAIQGQQRVAAEAADASKGSTP